MPVDESNPVPRPPAATSTASRVGPFAVAVAFAALAAYAASLGNGFVFDDQRLVVDNPTIHSLASVPQILTTHFWYPASPAIYYRPTFHLLSAGLYQIDGLNPLFFHLASVIAHALAAVLVFLLVERLYRDRAGAFVAGLLFALHPVQSEAVEFVSARTDLVAAIGVFGALLAHTAARGRGRHSLLAPALFLFGLLSKESAIAVLPGIVLIEICFRADLNPNWRELLLTAGRRVGPFVVVFAAYMGLRAMLLDDPLVVDGSAFRAINPLVDVALPGRALTAVDLCARYVGLLLWPVSLSVDYSANQIEVVRSVTEPSFVAAAVVVGGIAAAGLWALVRRPRLAFAPLFFLAALLPTLNVIRPGSSMFGERYLYVPAVGFAIVAGLAAGHLVRRRRRRAAVALVALLLVVCAVRIQLRHADWHDDERLFLAAQRATPRSAQVYQALANVYAKQGDDARARAMVARSLAIRPDAVETHLLLARLERRAGNTTAALERVAQALQLEPFSQSARVELGRIHEARQDPRRALAVYLEMSQLEPTSPGAWNLVASAHQSLGETESALAAYEKAVSLDGYQAPTHANLAYALATANRFDRAAEHFTRALRLDPEFVDAHFGLGVTYAKLGRLDDARAEFQRYLRAANGDHRYAKAAEGWLQRLGPSAPNG